MLSMVVNDSILTNVKYIYGCDIDDTTEGIFTTLWQEGTYKGFSEEKC